MASGWNGSVQPFADSYKQSPIGHSLSAVRYSLFWALCGALVIVALSGCATFVMTCPPDRTYQSWLSEPFDVARLKSWVDTTVSLSTRYPYRFARSTRQDQADQQAV